MGELKIIIKPEILLIINLIFVFILFLYLRRNNIQSVGGRQLEERLLSIQADIDKMSNTQQQIQGQIKTSGEMNQTGQSNTNSLVSERLNKV